MPREKCNDVGIKREQISFNKIIHNIIQWHLYIIYYMLFDAIWINYIVNGYQVSPIHHLYVKWKFIVSFTLCFEMLTQMSIRTLTHTKSSSSSTSSYHFLHTHIYITMHTINYQQIKWHAISYFCDSAIHLMHFKWTCTRVCAYACIHIYIECHTNAKIQNDFVSLFICTVIQMICFVHCICRTMVK